jgi:hypothetical protein
MRKLVLIVALMVCSQLTRAQQIDFGQFYDPTTLSFFVIQNLDFGPIIAGDTEPKKRLLGSGLEGVIEIEGLPFLDVIVTIQEISNLPQDIVAPCTDPECFVNVTINYAYTNTGIGEFEPGYENIAIPFTGNMARFQIVRRLVGPPGPPPPPAITGVSLPPLQKAFIYIFGEASADVGAPAGPYKNDLVVTIEYL